MNYGSEFFGRNSLPVFFFDSAVMKVLGRLIAWESIEDIGVRRWNVQSGGHTVRITLVHDGEIAFRESSQMGEMMDMVESAIQELGGDHDGDFHARGRQVDSGS